MKVLIVEPGERPYIKDIKHDLDTMHEIVGGYIEALYPYEDMVAIVCDEEGKLKANTQPNRYIPEINDIINGTFFICGIGGEDFTDLPDDLAEKYKQKFRCPEMFISTPNGFMVLALK